MRTTVRNVALVIAILAILIAIALLITAWIKLSRELPTPTPFSQPTTTTESVSATEIIDATPALVNSTPVNSTGVILPIPVGKLQFSEDFEDGFSNGISFNSGGWKVIDDGTGNKVLLNSSNGDAVIGPPYTPNFSDGVLEFRFKTANRMQVSFRLVSTNNGYTSYPLLYGLGSFQLHYQKNGAWQPIEGTTMNGSDQLFNNQWITLRIETQGNNINIYANGNLVISAYDSRISEGRIDFGGTDVQFDDFKVWDISQ